MVILMISVFLLWKSRKPLRLLVLTVNTSSVTLYSFFSSQTRPPRRVRTCPTPPIRGRLRETTTTITATITSTSRPTTQYFPLCLCRVRYIFYSPGLEAGGSVSYPCAPAAPFHRPRPRPTLQLHQQLPTPRRGHRQPHSQPQPRQHQHQRLPLPQMTVRLQPRRPQVRS